MSEILTQEDLRTGNDPDESFPGAGTSEESVIQGPPSLEARFFLNL